MTHDPPRTTYSPPTPLNPVGSSDLSTSMSVAFAAVLANVGFIGCMYYRPITEVLYPPNEWKLQIGDVRIASSTSTLEDTEQATCKVCGCSVVILMS
jgi:hypothetical protein